MHPASAQIDRPPPGEMRRLALLVAGVGFAGGAVGAAYLGGLALVGRILGPDRWDRWPHLVVLVLVGVAVTVLSRSLGDPGDVELLVDDIHVSGGPDGIGRLRSLIPISLLCVGAGGPLGPEAPLVTTTGSLAAWGGRRAGLDRVDRRILTITGMAAGFTVLFAAPLGSAVFALEILHRRGLEYHEALLPAAAGSLCGYVVSVALTGVGLGPIWAFPATTSITGADLAYGMAAGVVGALLAAAFTGAVLAVRVVARHLPSGSQPAVGGLVIGAMALVSPYALTNGEHQLAHVGAAPVLVGTLLAAAGVKLVAAAVATATGWRGGFIIPLFFVGACVGRAAGAHLPGGHEWVVAAALMVAVNVGVTKTPIGSTLVITEMAGIALLPTTLAAALVSLGLTSGFGLLHTQRERFDPLDEADDPEATP